MKYIEIDYAFEELNNIFSSNKYFNYFTMTFENYIWLCFEYNDENNDTLQINLFGQFINGKLFIREKFIDMLNYLIDFCRS